LYLLLQFLLLPKLIKYSFLAKERGKRAFLGNAPFLQHHDAVHFLDRGQTVRDDDRRNMLEKLMQGLKYPVNKNNNVHFGLLCKFLARTKSLLELATRVFLSILKSLIYSFICSLNLFISFSFSPLASISIKLPNP